MSFRRHSFKKYHSFRRRRHVIRKGMSKNMMGVHGFRKFRGTRRINRPRLVTRGGIRL